MKSHRDLTTAGTYLLFRRANNPEKEGPASCEAGPGAQEQNRREPSRDFKASRRYVLGIWE